VSPDPFANEPILELRHREARDALLAGMAALEPRLPIRVPILIGNERADGDGLLSTDPGDPDRLVALAPRATREDARRALDVASAAAPRWALVGAGERAGALARAADWMRRRRHELAALCVRECAKPWGEADADVCEAIDYLEYYARGAIALDQGATVIQVPGERNSMRYAPRGVCAVIAPWNFPIAIPCGMLSAALVTGNAAVLKPAEQAPACGAMVVEALRAGGVPPEAVGLLPGEGDVGSALVSDPRVHTIAFTGSAPVGLEIIRAAAEVSDGQAHVKRVVAEMGGKNCVIVDSDADLDEAVPAIVRSAFAYAGQKCSAASRILVHERIADALLQRVAGAVATLQIGQADAFGTDLGPVIERDAQARVGRYTQLAQGQGDRGNRPPVRLPGPQRGDLRPRARHRERQRGRRGPRSHRPTALRADGRVVQPQPANGRACRRALTRWEPLCQPAHHGRDGRTPAVRRQPPLGHRHAGRRPRLPAAVRRAAGAERERPAAWAGRELDDA
jgi:RHH-type proline utilization regulon transcriptional repressor/proline dehydrogenase/delta 1-pyrroline-5-carboxylate dehydrogenase